jgi:hypothetical protein
MRCSNFVGAVAFWRSVEKLAAPERRTRFHALGVLREFARLSFEDCAGFAFSPQHAECLEYCGFAPIGVRPLVQRRPNGYGGSLLPARNGFGSGVRTRGRSGACGCRNRPDDRFRRSRRGGGPSDKGRSIRYGSGDCFGPAGALVRLDHCGEETDYSVRAQARRASLQFSPAPCEGWSAVDSSCVFWGPRVRVLRVTPVPWRDYRSNQGVSYFDPPCENR